MAPNNYVTARSQERTIAMLRRKLRNAESCINKYRHKVVEIVQFVEDTDFDDNEDVLLSKNFVIEKSNEILNMTPENNEYIEEIDIEEAETDIEEAETDIDEFNDSDCDDSDCNDSDCDDSECDDSDCDDSDCDDSDCNDSDCDDEFTDSECDFSDSDEEMFDVEESQYIDDPAIVNNFDENEYVDMPPLIDLTNEEGDDEDCNNPLHYDYSYLNNEIHRFENMTINGVHYFHDKYGNVTGCQNLLLVFDSNGDLEAVDIYKPNLNIDISQSVLI
jgi:hypothetical protein